MKWRTRGGWEERSDQRSESKELVCGAVGWCFLDWGVAFSRWLILIV